MPSADEIRRGVRKKRPKPPPTPKPPETREQRLLRKFAAALEDPTPTGPLTPAQRAGYKGAAKGFLAGLRAGAFRRKWKRDREVVRAVQLACARWIEGTTDALPPGDDRPDRLVR
jgi:hypothetical protein